MRGLLSLCLAWYFDGGEKSVIKCFPCLPEENRLVYLRGEGTYLVVVGMHHPIQISMSIASTFIDLVSLHSLSIDQSICTKLEAILLLQECCQPLE